MTGLAQYLPLAAHAAAAVERREVQYPALIEAGKIGADQAAREIRVWRAIAADWRWVTAGEPADPLAAALDEKIAVLEDSRSRAERALRRTFAAGDAGVRQAWEADMPIATIADRFGEAAAPLLDAWALYWAMADLLAWYRRDLPGSDRPGITHYVDRYSRMEQGRAAA